jgi:hypothetical protein
MMIFQNGVKWVCIFLFLLMLISDGTANANSLQESSVQRIHNSAERVVTNRQLSTNIEQQKSEDDADGTHSEVHEFQAHSDKNGVVLVPLDPRQ